MLNEHPFLQNIPAYAIGALDPDEIADLEAHLETCQMCKDELAAFQKVEEGLLLSTRTINPPKMLRQKLISNFPGFPEKPSRRFRLSLSQFSVGFAMMAMFVLTGASIIKVNQLNTKHDQLTRQVQTNQIALAALSYPETQTIPINANNVNGTLLLAKEQNVAVLVMWNLPVLDPSQTYQVWLTDANGNQTDGGTFNAQAEIPYTSVPVRSSGSLAPYIGMRLSIEPSGGSIKPTGTNIFKVSFK